MSLDTDGEFVVFKGLDKTDGNYAYYVIEPESFTVQKLENSAGWSVVRVLDGKLYYIDEVIRYYDLKDGSRRDLSEYSTYSHQAYLYADFYENTLILRHGYGYYFVILDMETGTLERVQREE